jgi:hypothetical protein
MRGDADGAAGAALNLRNGRSVRDDLLLDYLLGRALHDLAMSIRTRIAADPRLDRHIAQLHAILSLLHDRLSSPADSELPPDMLALIERTVQVQGRPDDRLSPVMQKLILKLREANRVSEKTGVISHQIEWLRTAAAATTPHLQRPAQRGD